MLMFKKVGAERSDQSIQWYSLNKAVIFEIETQDIPNLAKICRIVCSEESENLKPLELPTPKIG